MFRTRPPAGRNGATSRVTRKTAERFVARIAFPREAAGPAPPRSGDTLALPIFRHDSAPDSNARRPERVQRSRFKGRIGLPGTWNLKPGTLVAALVTMKETPLEAARCAEPARFF